MRVRGGIGSPCPCPYELIEGQLFPAHSPCWRVAALMPAGGGVLPLNPVPSLVLARWPAWSRTGLHFTVIQQGEKRGMNNNLNRPNLGDADFLLSLGVLGIDMDESECRSRNSMHTVHNVLWPARANMAQWRQWPVQCSSSSQPNPASVGAPKESCEVIEDC